MDRGFWIAVAAAVVLWASPTTAAAQPNERATVYLVDGNLMTGQIIEYLPGDHVTLHIEGLPPLVIDHTRISGIEIGAVPRGTSSEPSFRERRRNERLARVRPLAVTTGLTGTLMLTGAFLMARANNARDFGFSYGHFISGAVLMGLFGSVWLVSTIFLPRRVRFRREMRERHRQSTPRVAVAPDVAPRQRRYGVLAQLIF